MMAKKWEKKIYQWNFKIKLQFTNFPLFISDYRSGCWLSVQKQQLDPLISIYNTLFNININININIYFRRGTQHHERPWICLESRPAPPAAAATWNMPGSQYILRHSVLCRRGLADSHRCRNQIGEEVLPPPPPSLWSTFCWVRLGTWRAGEPPPPAGSGAAGSAGASRSDGRPGIGQPLVDR